MVARRAGQLAVILNSRIHLVMCKGLREWYLLLLSSTYNQGVQPLKMVSIIIVLNGSFSIHLEMEIHNNLRGYNFDSGY